MTRFRTLLACLVPLALAACAVGPDFVRPSAPMQSGFYHGEDVSKTRPAMDQDVPASTGPADPAFWRSFDDPLLSELVETSLTANHDLRIALAHVEQANALLRAAALDHLPTVTASAAAEDGRSSTDQAAIAPQGSRESKSYSAGINAVWELDLFGRIRRNVEAGRADTEASAADLRAAQVAIVGQVARTYVGMRGLQERLRIAQANADNQRETLRIVETRMRAGRGTEFDTARARAQLESTSARIPALEAGIAAAMHRLAVLTGRTPDALIARLTPQQDVPRPPGAIDPGTPGDLVRRRPDVAAAEARLHAATARIGVATADLFPRFVLSGLLGTQAINASDVFGAGSGTRYAALGIDWSFLDVGRVRARIKATDAEGDAALARYEQVVLLALQDTEDTLVRYARGLSADRHLEQAAGESARAAQLAHVQFDAGAVDLLAVLDAERTLLAAQDAFAEGRARSASDAVALYGALAGGWPQALPSSKSVVVP